MATLKEFEEALREHGMHMALALLERLRERDRQTRTIRPARRLTGQKMTPDLARAILELHASTGMTQQEIAFKVGVNQGRVNEVIKRGKWLDDDPPRPRGGGARQGEGTDARRPQTASEALGSQGSAARGKAAGRPPGAVRVRGHVAP
ncbi:protein of unknown function [Methylorubrum extorquens]|uniref:RNA polymerase subunit sigma-70 n=1 Tax=Methylorubrum extorquens TaxID=408 RepID=A0A2N9AJ07_METEX|nr:protein of unknown function [Methylorubrum extorquens]